MTNEKINEIAIKFNRYCGVAKERYDEPKYVFAALLTMLDILDGKEFLTNEEKKEFSKTVAEPTKDVSHRENAHLEEKEKSSAAISAPFTILGIVPKTEFGAKILIDLVNLGCESLEDIKGIRAIEDRDYFCRKYCVMVKSRLARLPDYWNLVAINALGSMMKEKNLTLDIKA